MSQRLQSPLVQLQSAIDQRVQQESEYAAQFLQGPPESELALRANLQQMDDQHQVWQAAVAEQHQAAIDQINQTIDDQLADLHAEHQTEFNTIEATRTSEREEVEA